MGVACAAIAVLAVRVASDDERSHRDDADDDHAMEHPDQLPAVSA